MVSKKGNPNTGSGNSISKMIKNLKKWIVLISMILIGILLIAYRSNQEYWSEQFMSYNQYIFGISTLLLIIILIVVIFDIKMMIKYEFLGSILFAVGGLIIVIFNAQSYLGIESLGEDGTGFYTAGAVIIGLGTVMFMRNGGFVGACLGGIIVNIVVAGFYMFDNTSAIQYNSNTLLYINLSIVYFILSFFLLVYNEIKFFYLAKLMRDEKKFRAKKEYKKALQYCNKALFVYPYFVTGWNNKGNVLYNMGKKSEAVNCYKKALSINPDYIPAQRNLQQMG